MSERIEFLGSYCEKAKDHDTDFLKELEDLCLNRQDATAKSRVEKHLTDLGIDISKLTFHEGTNHIEWKRDGKDYFVIERHWQ